MVSGAGCKRKGASFELSLARYFADTTGLDARRQYATHDGKWNGEADLSGLPGLAVEAKRVEKLNFREAIRQAAKNAKPGSIPVVIARQNRQALENSDVVLPLKFFVSLYAAWLKEKPDAADKT